MSTEINNKLKMIATAMGTAETGFQHQLAQYAAPSELCGVSALVMMLAPVGVKAANDAAIADPTSKRPTRVTFMVLRLLAPGWSSLPANAAAISDKKGAKVKQAERAGDHCFAYSYQLVKRGGYAKGVRSPEGVMISPGMVFTLNTFPTNLAKVMKITEDMKTFDMGVVELMLKSTECTKGTEMMELKGLLAVKGCSPSSLRVVDTTLMPRSLQDAAAMKTRFGDGSYLTNPGENVKQEWLKDNLSATVSMMAFKVQGKIGNSFAIGADEILRFHGPVAGLPVDAFEVNYDARQFGGASMDWVAGLLNVVMDMCDDAVEVLVAMDSYQGKETTSAPVSGFVRLHLAALAAAWQSKDAIAFSALPPAFSTVFTDTKQHPNLVGIPFDDGKMHMVIDTRRVSRAAVVAATGKPPMLGLNHMDSQWNKGYNAYIFTGTRFVFQFVVSADTGSSTNLAGARGLQTLSFIAPTGVYDADDTAAIDNAANDNASNDNASNDNASNDNASNDNASNDTASNDTAASGEAESDEASEGDNKRKGRGSNAAAAKRRRADDA
jgi:hypothetical protein